MNKIDLIIDALEKAKDGWQSFDEYEKALTAARELKAELAKPEQEAMLVKKKPSQAYEEVQITPTLIWRWVREGDEYVMRIGEKTLAAHKIHIEAQLTKLKEKNDG